MIFDQITIHVFSQLTGDQDYLSTLIVLQVLHHVLLSHVCLHQPPESLEDNIYTLKDLQPKSIPIVRDLIKDVMLDIPYYLSSHKEKILEAVVAEANRVWELFCRCNPILSRERESSYYWTFLGKCYCNGRIEWTTNLCQSEI